MEPDPTLIIQMQRMGDLVLAFPLMAWLRLLEPEHPVWVVAEPHFFQELMELAPHVVFFPPEAAPQLRTRHFHRIINLSHRAAARRLAFELTGDIRLGGFEQDGRVHIYGDWHLYRASLVHNNRHNRLHWADLAALDAVTGHGLPRTQWPAPRLAGTGRRIGLFVGASEPAKRPGATFWGQLGTRLIQRGMNPVFLGGPDDLDLASAASAVAGVPGANLAGRFSLEKFADFAGRLDLLVTPDTGPMHIGAWVRAQTLNLSMGPVNPWETAPAAPGHFVLRAEPSCTGCWQCRRNPDMPPCQAAFEPERVASLITALMHGQAHKLRPSRLHLWQTARDARGLFELQPVGDPPLRPRDLRGLFWREAFLTLLGHPQPQLEPVIAQLRQHDPHFLPLLVRHTTALSRRLSRRHAGELWLSVPPLLRPLSGYLHMRLENDDCRPSAYEQAQYLTRNLLDFLV